MAFWNTGNQVGDASEGQCGREAADAGHNLTFETYCIQSQIDESLFESTTRNEDMLSGRVAGKRDLAIAQRVPLAYDPDIAVSE